MTRSKNIPWPDRFTTGLFAGIAISVLFYLATH